MQICGNMGKYCGIAKVKACSVGVNVFHNYMWQHLHKINILLGVRMNADLKNTNCVEGYFVLL